ncbi:HU family DNA-binding protein [Roseateles sp. GG27B]
MNKTELIAHLAAKNELTKADAGRILETLIDVVVTTVKKGGAVSIPGFGSFKQHSRAARIGVNPSTGDRIKILAAKLPKFIPGSTFKAAVEPKLAARKAAKAAAKSGAKPAPKGAVKGSAKAAAKPVAKVAVKAVIKPAAKAVAKPAAAPVKAAAKVVIAKAAAKPASKAVAKPAAKAVAKPAAKKAAK